MTRLSRSGDIIELALLITISNKICSYLKQNFVITLIL